MKERMKALIDVLSIPGMFVERVSVTDEQSGFAGNKTAITVTVCAWQRNGGMPKEVEEKLEALIDAMSEPFNPLGERDHG